MQEKILDTATAYDPVLGMFVGLLLILLTGSAGVIVYLWKEGKNQANDSRTIERNWAEKALLLLDTVSKGMAASERDRERLLVAEAERKSDRERGMEALAELRSMTREMQGDLRETRNEIRQVVAQRG